MTLELIAGAGVALLFGVGLVFAHWLVEPEDDHYD